MLTAALSGLLVGWAVAVPVGAVGALLVVVAVGRPRAVSAAAALGVATVDGAYAVLAVVAGAGLAALLAPVERGLRVVAAAVLLGVAVLLARPTSADGGTGWAGWSRLTPRRAFGTFVGLTAVNPATFVSFTAVVLARPHLADGGGRGVVFVAAVLAASASWQLLLTGVAARLGRGLGTERGRRATGLVGAAAVAALALWSLVGAFA